MSRCIRGVLFFATLAVVLGTQDFVVYSEPIEIARGQVHNYPTKVLSLPDDIINKYKGKSMGIVKFQADILKLDENGSEQRVPLYEAYDHHTIQAMGTKDLITYLQKQWTGSDPLGPHSLPHCGHADVIGTLKEAGWKGSVPNFYWGPVGGAEYRDADRDLPSPYRQIVDNPEAFVAILHVINVKAQQDKHPLFECPCTSDRVINATNGTIDGVKPLPFRCNQELLHEHNGNCKLDWYTGGYRCCENKAWVTEPQHRDSNKTDTFHVKFTFTIDDVTKETVPAYFMMLDGTGNNAEYDIPKCNLSDPMTHMEGNTCVHTLSFVQDIYNSVPQLPPRPLPWVKIELLTARGHQHVAGLGMELYNDRTGELLCKSTPRHGNGTEAGNEKGFIVGIPPCVWGPAPLPAPPVFRAYDKVRIVSRYNATEGHYGVMALWMMQAKITGHTGDLVV